MPPGTLIRTERGEVAVEDLVIGDLAVTAGGAAKPIVWIGHRHMDCRRHPTPADVCPVRVSAGGFGERLPRRDLWLSPDHAVLIDGVLIPARLLINGASIVRETQRATVTYYHVELDSHDILLAEGLPAESYLDTGNRAMFENGGQPIALHPDFAGGQRRRESLSCAPFEDRPDQTEPVWRALARRAEAMGRPVSGLPTLIDEPDLHIFAGSERVKPLVAKGGRYTFVLPRGETSVRLVSRAARPCDARPWIRDQRRLGVMVRRLSLRRGQVFREIAMDDQILERGWWQVESHEGWPHRWTDGDATLPIMGPGILEVEVSGSMRYQVDADQRSALLTSAGLVRNATPNEAA